MPLRPVDPREHRADDPSIALFAAELRSFYDHGRSMTGAA
jgi:hypothetical protein